MSENIRTLSGRLKALKGWLTQTISACANLIGMPRSIANDSFLRNRIEVSIQELDKRLGKFNDCLGELEACELSVELNDVRKLREESYKATRAQVASSHQDCLNRLVRTSLTHWQKPILQPSQLFLMIKDSMVGLVH